MHIELESKQQKYENVVQILPPRLWNTGLVSSGDILTSWGEGGLGWPPF